MNLALVKVQGEGSIMKSNFVVGTKSNLLQKNDIKKLSHKQKETLYYSTECFQTELR